MVFATEDEASILKGFAENPGGKSVISCFGHQVSVLVTGVGAMSTAWSLQQWTGMNELPDLAINAGIAGSFDENIAPGDVVLAESDCFADLGIENGDTFLTLEEAGFLNPGQFPFRDGRLWSSNKYFGEIRNLLKPVHAATVNTASGTRPGIERIKEKFNPAIETMEGATFFYICLRKNIPFLAVRAVSNMVTPGRRSEWNIPLALEKLTEKIKLILITLG